MGTNGTRNLQGEVYRGVFSQELRDRIEQFYDGDSDNVVHGRLAFLDIPELVTRVRAAMGDMDDWIPYHDLYITNTNTFPITWHNGALSVGFLRDPIESCTVWCPLVDCNEENGGRLIILNSLQHSIPAFYYICASSTRKGSSTKPFSTVRSHRPFWIRRPVQGSQMSRLAIAFGSMRSTCTEQRAGIGKPPARRT